MLFILLIIILLLPLVIVLYFKVIKKYSYWTERGIKQGKTFYFLGDNAGPILRKETFCNMLKRIYNDFPEERYFGMYHMTSPALVIRDPELLKTLMIKDFDYFVNHRPLFPDSNESIWTKNILSLKDNDWRHMRLTLSPSFTSSKMKMIFNLLTECSDKYVKYFENSNQTLYELKDTMTRYTNDAIFTVAYGVTCDSINDKYNIFYKRGMEMTTFTFKRLLTFFGYSLCPGVCKAMGLRFFPNRATKFFETLVRDTIKLRQENGFIRHDMIHLLMQARENEKMLSNEDLSAQAFIFFLGGLESVSTTLCFMGYELAINPDIQKKLQREIDETLEKCEGNITYEALLKMKYLDMVVSETLRKYPSNCFLDRLCTKPYTIPAVKCIEKDVHLNPGDCIFVSVYGLHNDPKYYPKPDQFNPERFSEENKDKIPSYAYVPFGLGPRICIAKRLALLKVKTLYFHLLAKFDLVAAKKTEIPLKMSNNTFTLLAQNGIWIELKPRTI